MSPITLPSGLVGEVRGLTGKDGRYLTNEQLVRDNEIEDYIFEHCWTGTVDEGPYHFDGGAPDWSRVLVGDRFYLLISVRLATYPGQDYVFSLKCPATTCRRGFEWEVDLEKLLAEQTRRLSDADRAAFMEGNRLTGTIPFTRTGFVFQLNTGAVAKKTRARIDAKKTGPKRLQERQNRIVDVVAGLILEIDGVPKKHEAIFDYLEELPMASLDAMLPLLQSHDCGVETDVEVACPRCGTEMRISLPFDRAFFLPSSAAAIRERQATRTTKEEPAEEESETDTANVA